MILLTIFGELSFCKQRLIVSVMESPPKANNEPSSILLKHELLDKQPNWSRCGSFSSSSNDSAVFCCEHRLHASSFSPEDCCKTSHQVINRKEISASSSSSDTSCNSHKNAKKVTNLTSESVSVKAELSSPESSDDEQQKSLNIPPSLESTVTVVPTHHNLRRNIRKKKCSCDCTATRTTLVMRRYKEVGQKTVEEKTVISRTKYKTCVNKNSDEELHKVTCEKNYSPSKSVLNKKQRSKVEKLCESLQEIEWTKKLSPDILRQMQVRQRSSFPLFGRLSKRSKSHSKPAKRLKDDNNFEGKTTFSKTQLKEEKSGDILKPSQSSRSSHILTNHSRRQCNQNATLNNFKHCNKVFNSDANCTQELNIKDPSKMNPIQSSVKHFRMVDNSDISKVRNSKSKQKSMINCKFISKSSGTTTCTNMNNFEFSNSNPNLKSCHDSSSINKSEEENQDLISEHTPTFFDIAEKGIRTIDACLREVGAEVVISTCYESNSNLPHLSPVEDSQSEIVAVEDNPPVLELCIPDEKLKVEDSDHLKNCLSENGKKSVINPCEFFFVKSFNSAHFSKDEKSNLSVGSYNTSKNSSDNEYNPLEGNSNLDGECNPSEGSSKDGLDGECNPSDGSSKDTSDEEGSQSDGGSKDSSINEECNLSEGSQNDSKDSSFEGPKDCSVNSSPSRHSLIGHVNSTEDQSDARCDPSVSSSDNFRDGMSEMESNPADEKDNVAQVSDDENSEGTGNVSTVNSSSSVDSQFEEEPVVRQSELVGELDEDKYAGFKKNLLLNLQYRPSGGSFLSKKSRHEESNSISDSIFSEKHSDSENFVEKESNERNQPENESEEEDQSEDESGVKNQSMIDYQSDIENKSERESRSEKDNYFVKGNHLERETHSEQSCFEEISNLEVGIRDGTVKNEPIGTDLDKSIDKFWDQSEKDLEKKLLSNTLAKKIFLKYLQFSRTKVGNKSNKSYTLKCLYSKKNILSPLTIQNLSNESSFKESNITDHAMCADSSTSKCKPPKTISSDHRLEAETHFEEKSCLEDGIGNGAMKIGPLVTDFDKSMDKFWDQSEKDLEKKQLSNTHAKKIFLKYLQSSRKKVIKNSYKLNTSKCLSSKKVILSPLTIQNLSNESSFKEPNISDQAICADTSTSECESPKPISSDHTEPSLCTHATESQGNQIASSSAKNFSDPIIEREKNKKYFYATHKTSLYSLPMKKPVRSLSDAGMSPHVPDGRVPTPSSSIKGLEEDSITYTSHYKTVEVHRHADYMQVVLNPTHGLSCYFTLQSLNELTEVVRRTNQDPHLHTLILNGVGQSFSLGLDISPLIGPQKREASKKIAIAVKYFIEALFEFKKPFAVIVNGAAHGLAVTMLSHADVIIASEHATFCMPQSLLGYFPEGGATLTLPRAVGATVAMDLMLRGRTITAREAQSIGLVSDVVKEERIPAEIVSRLKLLRAISPSNAETTKAMVKLHLQPQLLSVLENEAKILPQMWLSDSCQEALRASRSALQLLR